MSKNYLTAYFLDQPIRIIARWIGDDLSVFCTGGDHIHIGGVSIAVPYTRATGTVASVSTLSVPEHQDYVLAAEIAKQLCKKYKAVVCVQCGIHYDDLKKEELKSLCQLVLGLCEQMEVQHEEDYPCDNRR